jgi:GAF domain-containing protein/HAMP domain-containing protein
MMKPRSSLFNILEKTSFGRMNLRTKLILGNLLITFIAIVGMGFYVYFRTRESNDVLTSQFELSVQNKAKEKLYTTSKEQAALLNGFFESMGNNISMLGKIEKNMFSKGESLNSGKYWDASVSLFRLPSGSWDNANIEVASIFMPAGVELTENLVSKLNIVKQTELIAPTILLDNPDIVAIYFGGTSKETVYFPNIDLANIVPPDFNVTERPWYIAASPKQNPEGKVVWSTPYQDAALNGLVITTSIPVFDSFNRFQGVSAMDIQLNRITNLISAIDIGETGYAFLVDKDNRLIALPEAGYNDFGVTSETSPLGEILDQTKLTNMSSGFWEVLNRKSSSDNLIINLNINGAERFVIYQQIPVLQYSLVIIVPSEELLLESSAAKAQTLKETKNIITTSVLLVIIILTIASLATLAVGNNLTAPLKSLTGIANEIINGNYDAKAEVQNQDEIGILAETLNIMTAAIKGSVNTLEQRVSERTSALQVALEKGARRGKQFEAITQVSRTINATHNLSQLLPQISRVISEQFNYYHVGIFLNDANNLFAVLSAANSEGGKKMLARGHQLKIGEQGIVGYVTQTGHPRIALDVGADINYFNNPDLPLTRSEMALPLKTGNQVVGTLDIQSTEANAFTDQDFEALSALTDQVSLAIQNARLFDQTEKTLAEADAIQRQYIRETWSRLPKEEKLSGFRYSVAGTVPLDIETIAAASIDMKDKREINVPIILRGETIGTLIVQVPKSENLGTDQVDLIKAVAERVALSAENARLFGDTTRRAERERIISDIASKIGTSVRTESILRTTATELSQLLEDADIFINLQVTNKDKKDTE